MSYTPPNLCLEIPLPTSLTLPTLPTTRNKYEEEIFNLRLQIKSKRSDLVNSRSVLRWMDYKVREIRIQKEIDNIEKEIEYIKYNNPEYFV